MQIKGYVVPRRKQNGIRLIKPERVPGDLPSMNTGLDELSWILQINHSLHPGEEGGAYQCPDLHSQARTSDLQVPQAEPSSRAASAGKAEKTTSSPSHYTWLTTHTVLRGQRLVQGQTTCETVHSPGLPVGSHRGWTSSQIGMFTWLLPQPHPGPLTLTQVLPENSY